MQSQTSKYTTSALSIFTICILLISCSKSYPDEFVDYVDRYCACKDTSCVDKVNAKAMSNPTLVHYVDPIEIMKKFGDDPKVKDALLRHEKCSGQWMSHYRKSTPEPAPRAENTTKPDPCKGDDWVEKAKLGCKELEGAELEGAELSNAKLNGANLSNANLKDANLPFADLEGANLSNANLFFADLTNANLEGANLSNANLTNAFGTAPNLTGANLTGAVLRRANLTEANLTGVTWDDTTCPDGTKSKDNGNTCCGHLKDAVPSAGCD